MVHFAVLEVSIMETNICIVDDAGRVLRPHLTGPNYHKDSDSLSKLRRPFNRLPSQTRNIHCRPPYRLA